MDNRYECPRCNNTLIIPPEMNEADQTEIALVSRSGGKINAMGLIREKFKFGLRESKVMMVHISDPRDHCANCRNKLLESGITYCPSCSGLNLNW